MEIHWQEQWATRRVLYLCSVWSEQSCSRMRLYLFTYTPECKPPQRGYRTKTDQICSRALFISSRRADVPDRKMAVGVSSTVSFLHFPTSYEPASRKNLASLRELCAWDDVTYRLQVSKASQISPSAPTLVLPSTPNSSSGRTAGPVSS